MAAPGDFFLVVQRNQAFGFIGPGGTIYMYIIYIKKAFYSLVLTHWGRVTHICISKLTIIDSDNGLSPGWRQAIIWTNAGILLIGPLGTNLSEILIEIHTLSCTKMCWKMSSEKWRPLCLALNTVEFHPFVIHFVLCLCWACIVCLWNIGSQQ